jgi:hypothetical protein
VSDLLGLPESRDPHSLAEWAEMLMLAEEIDDLSSTEMLSQFPSGQRPPMQDIEMTLSIVEDRAQTSPSLYPFRRVEDRIVRTGKADSQSEPIDLCIYLFLRVACLQGAPWVLANDAALVGSLFDYLVLAALLSMMGDGGEGVIFGWPPRHGRPTDFIKAVTWLAEHLGIPDGDLDRPADANDGGVDVVVWKPFGDARTGFPLYFVQASVEYNIVAKAGEAILIEGWKRWIKFGAGPTTVFATAHSVPKGSTDWMLLNDLVAVIVDRNRLLELLEGRRLLEERHDWLDAICDFAAGQLDTIKHPSVDEPGRPRTRRRKRQRRGPHEDPQAR